MIAPELIEEVRRRANPVELVGTRVRLERRGRFYAGACPFHEDRNASFRLYPAGKRYICFGCGAGGDLFEFLQRADGKPFPVVVREVATSLGIALPREPLSEDEERARAKRVALLAACEAAATHWQRQLWGKDGERAREYLARRGISEEAARAFRLGYALDAWNGAQGALEAAGIAPAVQREAGVLAAREGVGARYHDRFRDRIVFPTLDRYGRVIGFAGRALRDDAEPTYLSSPETPLYKKSHTIFGLFQAREAIRHGRKAILVEGYFDVLALHQAGFVSTVGTGGPALSSEQLNLLAATGCEEVVLLFDGDEEGAMATQRAARVLLGSTLTASVARLPPALEGQSDPDAFLGRFGRRGMEAIVDQSRPLTDFLIDDAIRRRAGGLGTQAPVEHKLAVLRAVAPLVLAASEGLPRATFERVLARRLDLDIGPLRQELQRASNRGRP
ncbi:DNA primase [Anaeromyxobacter paludicola]|uniref:DNA primase n=1 Tax=Anaeromyxobacter paludicola TaxID=2918171 RepID=A0ABN6N7X6_9BACT|nr:DNA primase [Anaeromyxobacter paludicola]BDG08635.1 hypothetical protein AMPC_17480 [Anaeromyxobacter paludicola]